jgi:hypothetical protein
LSETFIAVLGIQQVTQRAETHAVIHVKSQLYVSDGITMETAGQLLVIFSNNKLQANAMKHLLSSYVCAGRTKEGQ